MRARKGSFNTGDATGAEATSSPPEEGGPSDGAFTKERRGECVARAGAGGGQSLWAALLCPLLEMFPSAGGRGHQVHKSWPISMSDSEGSLDPSPGSGEGPTGLVGGVACHAAQVMESVPAQGPWNTWPIRGLFPPGSGCLITLFPVQGTLRSWNGCHPVALCHPVRS